MNFAIRSFAPPSGDYATLEKDPSTWIFQASRAFGFGVFESPPIC